MDQPRHRLMIEAENGDEVLLACPESGCGRRIVVQRGGGIVVLAKGDFSALHSGGRGDLAISPPTAA